MTAGFKIGRIKLSTTTMIWWILAITSAGALLIATFHTSNFVYYLADALNIFLAIFAIKKVHKARKMKEVGALVLLLVLFVINCIIGIIGNNVSLKLSIWGSRNVYRFILFFISCATLLRKEDIIRFQTVFPKIYIINAIIAVFQYFVLGLKGDYIGGLFGTIQGCNGALTIFLNIALSYFIAGYLCGDEKLSKLIMYSVVYFLVAALSETKGNYVFFLLIVAVALLVSKKSFKTFGIICVAFMSLGIGMYLLNKYFPGSLDFLLDPKEANRYMNASYFGTVTFTRNAALSVANKVFFKDDLWLYLFGYGIGACDTSGFFSSPFYDMYGYMNYRQLSSSMTVLQNGYTGLAIYFLFFAYLFILGLFKSGKSENSNTKRIMIMTCCLAAFAIGDSFYASLYIDAAYWLFFALAIPLVIIKEE
ncbi:MAG: hypothetical protein PHX08_12430 [Lachnospiraceae bacterium]|nr:hypothetical protein [Lachnospiraceae bacterium]